MCEQIETYENILLHGLRNSFASRPSEGKRQTENGVT
jgi:hypothetical protein